jgi:hypothetical protein
VGFAGYQFAPHIMQQKAQGASKRNCKMNQPTQEFDELIPETTKSEQFKQRIIRHAPKTIQGVGMSHGIGISVREAGEPEIYFGYCQLSRLPHHRATSAIFQDEQDWLQGSRRHFELKKLLALLE